jgi:hypothetical protein
MFQTEVVFLGHIVSKEGVRPDPSNIAKKIGWPRPENPKQMKQFVATGSYYRRFIKNFAKIARPLIDRTKKGVEFTWNRTCEGAFNRLKPALTSPNVMGFPLSICDIFILDTDTSGVGIFAVLAQIQDNREKESVI